jgi:hypothetical protein
VQDVENDTEIETEIKTLGCTEEDAARALFRDMLAFEGTFGVATDEAAASRLRQASSSAGVDAILIEACLEKGVGLAVMERVNSLPIMGIHLPRNVSALPVRHGRRALYPCLLRRQPC